MKKFFAAVCCCALVAMNVSAQEPIPVAGDIVQGNVAQSIIEAPDSEATPVSAQDAPAAAAPATETPAPMIVESAPATVDAAATQGIVTQGYQMEVPMQSSEMGMGAAPYMSQNYAVPVNSGCGCGQAAPMMNYAPAMNTGCNTCNTCNQPAVSDCCDNGRNRPQVISRFRGRMTSMGGRRNNNCCN